MRNITLTTNRHTPCKTGYAKVLVNWNNVNWAGTSTTPYGDSQGYVELNFGGNHNTIVRETLEEIEEKLK